MEYKSLRHLAQTHFPLRRKGKGNDDHASFGRTSSRWEYTGKLAYFLGLRDIRDATQELPQESYIRCGACKCVFSSTCAESKDLCQVCAVLQNAKRIIPDFLSCPTVKTFEDPDDSSICLDPKTLEWYNKDEGESIFISQWRDNPKRPRLVYYYLAYHFDALRQSCEANSYTFRRSQLCLICNSVFSTTSQEAYCPDCRKLSLDLCEQSTIQSQHQTSQSCTSEIVSQSTEDKHLLDTSMEHLTNKRQRISALDQVPRGEELNDNYTADMQASKGQSSSSISDNNDQQYESDDVDKQEEKETCLAFVANLIEDLKSVTVSQDVNEDSMSILRRLLDCLVSLQSLSSLNQSLTFSLVVSYGAKKAFAMLSKDIDPVEWTRKQESRLLLLIVVGSVFAYVNRLLFQEDDLNEKQQEKLSFLKDTLQMICCQLRYIGWMQKQYRVQVLYSSLTTTECVLLQLCEH